MDQRNIGCGAYLLSRLYINGWGVEKDYGLARQYATRSIQLDLEDGQATLGYLAINGYGEAKDTDRSLKLYHKKGLFFQDKALSP